MVQKLEICIFVRDPLQIVLVELVKQAKVNESRAFNFTAGIVTIEVRHNRTPKARHPAESDMSATSAVLPSIGNPPLTQFNVK